MTGRKIWFPERIDEAFDDLKNRLGRVPFGSEFNREYPGAYDAIYSGRYHPEVRFFSDYLRKRDLPVARELWSPKKVDKAFDDLTKELEREPSSVEFIDRFGGAQQFISSGKYDPNIHSWPEYLVHRGFEIPGWTPEKVDKAFDELMKKLRRVPQTKEFLKDYPGALSAITQGRYRDDILNFGDYITHRGFTSIIKRWDPSSADEALDSLMNELGRTPSSREFEGKTRGALAYITGGDYNPSVKTWKQYLEHRGLEPRKWTPQKVDKAFDEIIDEFGRVPTIVEFGRRFRGAADYIVRGGYNPGIRKWSEYLSHRGFKQEAPIKTLEHLQDFLQQNPTTQYLASLATDSRYTAEILDILQQMFPDRIKDKAGLTEALVKSSIGDAVFPFTPPSGEIIPPTGLFKIELPDNIKNQLEAMLYKIFVEHFQPRFNKDPRSTLNDLENETKTEDPFVKDLMMRTRRFYEELFEMEIPGIGRLSAA